MRFLGNVEVGTDIARDELATYYDAVVFATGAAVDRRLGVPGEDLPGSFSATEFVAWYCGHPDAELDLLHPAGHARDGDRGRQRGGRRGPGADQEGRRAAPAPTCPGTCSTCSPPARSTEVTMLGRRGPAHARFTTKELRELGEIAGSDVIVDPADLELSEQEEAEVAADRTLRANLEVLRGWVDPGAGGPAAAAADRVLAAPGRGARLGRGERVRGPSGPGWRRPAGRHRSSRRLAGAAGAALGRLPGGAACPGCRSTRPPARVPHDGGRVLADGVPMPGMYVAGWLKRGPTGMIGTNKSDATETVASLLADADGLPRAPERDPDAIVELLLRAEGPDRSSWSGWEAIDAAEQALGVGAGLRPGQDRRPGDAAAAPRWATSSASRSRGRPVVVDDERPMAPRRTVRVCGGRVGDGRSSPSGSPCSSPSRRRSAPCRPAPASCPRPSCSPR